MTDFMNDLLGFVDADQLSYTEEAREGLNRGRLIQGNPEFAKDPALNQTVRYLGGIGLSTEGLSEDVIKQGTIVTINDKDYVAFQSLEVVVLASSRIRRFYAEIEGNQRLACGTNQDGQNAKGWSGIACKSCQYFPKNFVSNGGDKADACRADVAALVYIPSLDHVAILSFHGASYMEATAWLDQVAKLSRAFAQKPEVQAKNPGLARVNSWFFRTTLSAGAFEKGNDNNQFQRLSYTKAEQPFNWESLMNTPATLKRVKEVWADLESLWKQVYVDHNANAVMALPSADAVAALPANSSAAQPVAGVISQVTVPAAPAEQTPASPAPGVTVSAITIDGLDDVPEAQPAPAPVPAQPLTVPMGF
jgi:hypothetical protein